MIMNRYIWCLNPAILRMMSRWNKILKDSEKQESGCFISVSYFICTDWISLGDLAERNLAACAELAYIISKMVLAEPNTKNTSNCLKHFLKNLDGAGRCKGRVAVVRSGEMEILTLAEMRCNCQCIGGAIVWVQEQLSSKSRQSHQSWPASYIGEPHVGGDFSLQPLSNKDKIDKKGQCAPHL